MRTNLYNLACRATESERIQGADWYPAVRRIVSEWSATYGHSRETVACVIAALSPQVDWPRNLIMADDVLADRPLSIRGLETNTRKAYQLARSAGTVEDMLSLFPYGPKVNSFAANLAGDDTVITIDTHAVQAAMNDPTLVKGIKWAPYTAIATAYATVATELAIPWPTFQATIWIVWKRLHSPEQKRAIKRLVRPMRRGKR